MLTKQQVQNMREDELRKTVLVPLFRAMNFRDVYEYHGGSEEKGKDLVCWQEDRLGVRRNLALVVKAKAVSGKASIDVATAGEIAMQINQCFGKPFIDPVTGEQESVHDCWVISNKPLSKVAIDAIVSGLGKSVFVDTIRFIGIDFLWDLIEKYLPFQAAYQKLEDIQKAFEEWDNHYRLDMHLTNEGTQFSLVEKYPGAAMEKPIEIEPVFSFPNSAESKRYQDALQQLFDTGTPVTIPATYIESVGFSDFLEEILPSLTESGFLQLSSQPPQQALLLRCDIICKDGEQLVLEYLDMKCVQAGKKEVTLTNQHQALPIKLHMTIRFEDGTSCFHFTLEQKMPAPVYQLFLQMKFLRCMSKPHMVRLTNIETGILNGTSQNEQGLCDPPDERIMEDLAALNILQERAGKAIVLPDRELTLEEMQIFAMLRRLSLTGKLNATWEDCHIVLNVNQDDRSEIVQQLQQFLEGEKIGIIVFSQEERITLFGHEYSLGRFNPASLKAKLSNELEVKTFFDQGQEGSLDLHFVPADGNSLTKEYPDWHPTNNMVM